MMKYTIFSNTGIKSSTRNTWVFHKEYVNSFRVCNFFYSFTCSKDMTVEMLEHYSQLNTSMSEIISCKPSIYSLCLFCYRSVIHKHELSSDSGVLNIEYSSNSIHSQDYDRAVAIIEDICRRYHT